MKNTTPSGTRTFSTSRPFGRTVDSITSPTGSGSAATVFQRRGDFFDPRGREPQAVDFRVGESETRRGREIGFVGFSNFVRTRSRIMAAERRSQSIFC